MAFRTLYWDVPDLGDEELDRAASELASPTGAVPYADAFLTLLRSDSIPAVGIALDYYTEAQRTSRWGFENTFARFEDEVLAAARKLLRQPPVSSDDADTARGESHASALYAMLNLAEPEDAELIAHAIAEKTTNQSDVAFEAATTALDLSDFPNTELVEVLIGVVFDETADQEDRCAALSALGGARSTAAVEAAVRATSLDDHKLQAWAALNLAYQDFDTHRALIERLVASWPADGPGYPASEVRRFLREVEEVTALSEVVRDSAKPLPERVAAIDAIKDVESPVAITALERATTVPDVGLQAHAALALLDEDSETHRPLVARLAASWPADAPDPADEVRAALREDGADDE